MDEVSELEADVVHLMGDVDRYRTACNDALEQIDWCIGYLTGSREAKVAATLSSNRDAIRKNLLHRPARPLPDPAQAEPSR